MIKDLATFSIKLLTNPKNQQTPPKNPEQNYLIKSTACDLR